MEEIEKVEQVTTEPNDNDYIKAITELKQNTVSKESYDKLKSENKKLIDTLVNGGQLEAPKKETVDIGQLRKELFNKDGQMTNLEYVTKSLELRNALLEKGERDPFLPYGDKVNVTAEHYDKAENVARILQECVDFADGDSGIFTAELQRRTKDSSIFKRR